MANILVYMPPEGQIDFFILADLQADKLCADYSDRYPNNGTGRGAALVG